MQAIGIGQLRGYTRTYVERAAAGETFEVLRRGRPVARLHAVIDDERPVVPVPLSDLRTRPAQVFDKVVAGETIMVTYRGRNVATLRPLGDLDGRAVPA
jgi:prevent-host-death family protein